MCCQIERKQALTANGNLTGKGRCFTNGCPVRLHSVRMTLTVQQCSKRKHIRMQLKDRFLPGRLTLPLNLLPELCFCFFRHRIFCRQLNLQRDRCRSVFCDNSRELCCTAGKHTVHSSLFRRNRKTLWQIFATHPAKSRH